jgi:hypothetical protein
MIFRRIRGLLTTGALWGLTLSLTVTAFTSAFFLLGPNRGSAGELLSQLADILPMAFGLGGSAGVIFASLVLLGERRRTLGGISERRFQVWGMIAGAVPIAVLEGITRSGQHHSSLMAVAYSILGGGFAGASLAQALLRMARRGEVERAQID